MFCAPYQLRSTPTIAITLLRNEEVKYINFTLYIQQNLLMKNKFVWVLIPKNCKILITTIIVENCQLIEYFQIRTLANKLTAYFFIEGNFTEEAHVMYRCRTTQLLFNCK